jgi:hypothetical protein
MRLVIDAGTYVTAARAFTSANQIAAIQYDSLVGKLGSYAAMAGDDSTSADFAAAYDAAAAEAVGAFADLVPAFANLGRLTGRCAANHRDANACSIIAGPVVYDGTSSLPDSDYVSVLGSAPPSALGGDSPVLSSRANWILDHIEGFVWPNADTDRLRDAARVWQVAADGLFELVDRCRDAVAALEAQSSPEVPLALAAVDEIQTAVGDIASEFYALGRACERYADQVDEKRKEILALVDEILEMIVEGIVISAAIGLITGGAGAVASSGAVIARVVAQSPRFAAILNALRALVEASATALRTARTALRTCRLRLTKFVDARLPVRDEFGHLALGSTRRWKAGWLASHERSGSHTILKHVNQSLDDLWKRFHEPRPPGEISSAFPDQGTAERAISKLLDQKTTRINSWLDQGGRRLPLSGISPDVIGTGIDRAGNVSELRGITVILHRDPAMPDGFRIWTAYPSR